MNNCHGKHDGKFCSGSNAGGGNQIKKATDDHSTARLNKAAQVQDRRLANAKSFVERSLIPGNQQPSSNKAALIDDEISALHKKYDLYNNPDAKMPTNDKQYLQSLEKKRKLHK